MAGASAIVECISGASEDSRSLASSRKRMKVAFHLGCLFLDGKKVQCLRGSLAGPPWRASTSKGSVGAALFLRLSGGCLYSFVFDKAQDADSAEHACWKVWEREAADVAARDPAFIHKVSQMLQSAAAGQHAAAAQQATTSASGRDRSRTPQRAARVLKRLNSVEVEGEWRRHRSRDLEDEAVELQNAQQELLKQERVMRLCMTRRELVNSLEKEWRLHQRAQAAQREAAAERDRLEVLKAEEGNLVKEVGILDNAATTKAVATEDDPNSTITPEDATCVLCCNARRSVVLIPCRHFLGCRGCSRKITTCPVCKEAIQWRLAVHVA